MAGAARDGSVRAGQRKRRVVVIKRGIQPSRGGMADRAVLREIGGHMVRHAGNIGRAVVVLHVAAVAGGRQRPGVVIGVASGARNRRMRAVERECRRIVVKRGV